MFKDLRFSYKISLLPVVAAAALLVLLVFTLVLNAGTGGLFTRIEKGYINAFELSRDLQETMASIQRAMQDAVSASEAELLGNADTQRDFVLKRLDEESKNPVLPAGKLAEIRSRFTAYYDFARRTTQGMIAGTTSQDDVGRMVADYNALKQILVDFSSSSREEMNGAVLALQGNLRRSSIISAVITVVALAALLVLSYWIVRAITRPVNAAVEFSRRVAAGDLSRTMEVPSGDEIGVLIGSVNDMVDSLRRMVHTLAESFAQMDSLTHEIIASSSQISKGGATQSQSLETLSGYLQTMNGLVRQCVDTLSSTSENTSSSTAELSSSVNQIASSTGTLADLVETVSSSVMEMSASVKQVSENAGLLNARVQDTSDSVEKVERSLKEIEERARQSLALSGEVTESVAQRGTEALRRTVEGFDNIATVVRGLSETVRSLEDASSSIGNIVNVINEINDQTNLLALNASILAAQAGEQGKGFSVVASEIRDLAERTAVSTKEVADLIKKVQNGTAKAVSAVESGTRIVAEGVTIVGSLQTTLEGVAENSRRASDASRLIAESTTEQVATTQTISDFTRRVSQMAREVSMATVEQSKTSGEIVRIVANMRDQTLQVKRSTGEQNQSTRLIAEASQESRQKAHTIADTAEREAARVKEIFGSIKQVSDVAAMNMSLVEAIEGKVILLSGKAEEMRGEISRFKT